MHVQAQKCQSIFSSLLGAQKNLYNDYKELRKNYGLEALNSIGNLGTTIASATLDALSISYQKKVYSNAGVVPMSGDGTIGPRYLLAPCANVSGSLVTERTFVTVPSGFDKLYITIKVIDGNGEADISACLKDEFGNVINQKDKNVKGDGNSIEFVFFGTENRYATIHLVKKLGLNNFKYTISIKGEVNTSKEDIQELVAQHLEDEKTTNSTGTTGGTKLPELKGNTKITDVKTPNPKTGAILTEDKLPTYNPSTAGTSKTPTQGAIPKVGGGVPNATLTDKANAATTAPAKPTIKSPMPATPNMPKGTLQNNGSTAANSQAAVQDSAAANNTIQTNQKGKGKKQRAKQEMINQNKEEMEQEAKEKYEKRQAKKDQPTKKERAIEEGKEYLRDKKQNEKNENAAETESETKKKGKKKKQ
jgi:hypothetical protein